MAIIPEQPSQAVCEKIYQQNVEIDKIREDGAALVAIAVKQQIIQVKGSFISIGLIPPDEYFGLSNSRRSVVVPITDNPIECPARSVLTPRPKPRIVIPCSVFETAEIQLGLTPVHNWLWEEFPSPTYLTSDLDALVQQATTQGQIVA